MKKLERADVLTPAEYAPLRDARRAAVIELKRRRRVSVGPQVTLVFENRETMRNQVEEMCRVEGISDGAKVQEELDVYNRVLGGDGELAATLFIEVSSDVALRRVLETLVGLQEHVWLVNGDERVRATFDPDQFSADKLAAVQYLKFPVGKAGIAGDVRLQIDHPNYQHEARVSEATRAELARDLRE